ncbi:phage major capsid protein [Paroceanicella profunda]|uniref:Phage major capsid protein n=1 Tax=Paroceanicella profunda TaxID=2579971 RepID=A0A5B8FVT6_9RHOB|nr:phage major capsid protein [Paroceanicella profunda]QDL91504.1 phage major capsid protein [Paroceanicella profunda]
MPDLNDLRRARAAASDALQAASAAIDGLEAAETPDATAIAAAETGFAAAEAAFEAADRRVKRAESAAAAEAAAAATPEAPAAGPTAPATARTPADRGIGAALCVMALAAGGGDVERAVRWGEANGHSGAVAALTGAVDAAGGVNIPAPLAAEVIDLLRPRVVVANAGCPVIDMPAGQMRQARLAASATASYGAENAPAVESAPEFDQVDMSFKTLRGLVPVGNALLRHASTPVARVVRDDLVNVMGTREDLAFLRGDGSGGTPTGLRNWALAANWAVEALKTPEAVEARIRRTVNLVEDADVALARGTWAMRASTKNFLASLRHPASGALVFPGIEQSGTLMGYPILTSSQIPDNLGAGGDETEITFFDAAEIMIGDSMALSIALSSEASYVDTSGDTISAFQRDLTLVRAIREHDLAPMHDQALAGFNGTGWSL